jgi:hypothetical protein
MGFGLGEPGVEDRDAQRLEDQSERADPADDHVEARLAHRSGELNEPGKLLKAVLRRIQAERLDVNPVDGVI